MADVLGDKALEFAELVLLRLAVLSVLRRDRFSCGELHDLTRCLVLSQRWWSAWRYWQRCLVRWLVLQALELYVVAFFWLVAVHPKFGERSFLLRKFWAVPCSKILSFDHFSLLWVCRVCLQVQHFNLVNGIHGLFALSFEEIYVTYILKVTQRLISFTWVVRRSILSPKIEVRKAGIRRNIQTSMMFSSLMLHSCFDQS